MISLNYRDSRPIYEQIRDGLRKLIVTGALSADEKLPSVRALAAQLAINPNTIQRAYAQLERQGYIYSVKGKGSFVAAESRIRVQMVRDWGERFEEVAAQGMDMGIREEEMVDRIRDLAERRRAGSGMAKEREKAGSGTPQERRRES